ncbi:MAG TPA: protein kinase [Bryobacteraceae bacterium]|nr:protein kinase [Bryobacteraceae bacterium]
MPDRIGKYQIEKELGQGGFGRVCLAFDPDVGQKVAIKKLLAKGDPDLLKRFQLEIRTTAALRHKNIVTIHASGEDEGDPYLVMEFLGGQTLKDVIQSGRPLTLLEKVRIMTQVAEGLGYANSKGVVHRDVKPENIMLLADDNVKIMDFGIALGPNRNTAMTQTGGIIGTPPYLAPEQLRGCKANEQTDIFSFGDVYYELLTGVHPFEPYKNNWEALYYAIMNYEPKSIGELVTGCPAALEDLVHRALAKEPEIRYQKFEEIQLDNEAVLVDLRHEGAAAILREIPALTQSGDLTKALTRINYASQLDPANREARRLREEINYLLRKDQVQGQVTKILSDADTFRTERRYAEEVDCLALAARLDSRNGTIASLLEQARSRLEALGRANRLVAEARVALQKGRLSEAASQLNEALSLAPDHPDALRLRQRMADESERRLVDQRRQQAIRMAQEQRAAKRFAEALEILDAAAKEEPDDGSIAELRTLVQNEQAEETHRIRREKLNLAISRTRETLQAGDIDRARQMLDYLDANFASEPGALGVLQELRRLLQVSMRDREIAGYHQTVRVLIGERSFPEALNLLEGALGRFPGDAGLERSKEAARALLRAEGVAGLLKQAAARGEAGDLQGAAEVVAQGRREFGDEPSLVNLARQFEIQLQQQRYSVALENLLKEGRQLASAGRYGELMERLDKFPEFAGEADVRALASSARAAVALEQERSFVQHVLTSVARMESEQAWTQALNAVEKALNRFPHNPTLAQAANGVRERAALEQRRVAIAAEGEAIRQQLNRTHAADIPQSGSFDSRQNWILYRRREDLRSAVRDLETARDRYPDEPLWRTIESEIAGRRVLLDSETAIAKRIRESLELEDTASARVQWIEAQQRYPDQEFWVLLRGEIEAREQRPGTRIHGTPPPRG